jgi:hypothetical protein
MGAPDLIFQLRNSGYSIRVDGSYLDISPAELPPELVQQLKHNKTEILCVLHREDELKRLVLSVSKRCGFSKEDYEEALHHALNNPVNAIACFKELERQTNLITSIEVQV